MKPKASKLKIAVQPRPEDDWTYFTPGALRAVDLRPITALEQMYGYYTPA